MYVCLYVCMYISSPYGGHGEWGFLHIHLAFIYWPLWCSNIINKSAISGKGLFGRWVHLACLINLTYLSRFQKLTQSKVISVNK